MYNRIIKIFFLRGSETKSIKGYLTVPGLNSTLCLKIPIIGVCFKTEKTS